MQTQFLAFLLFFQTIVGCQNGPQNPQLSEADLAYPTIAAIQNSPENAPPVAANIVFKSTDGGQTWQDISAGLPLKLPVNCIFANGEDFFLGAENGLFRTKTAATVPFWAKEPIFFFDENIMGYLPGRAGMYAHSSWGNVFQNVMNTGAWVQVFTGLKPNHIYTMLETANGGIIAGTNHGIFKSGDAGKTWKLVSKDEQIWTLAELDGILIGGCEKGLLRSTDGGENWTLAFTGDGPPKKVGVAGGRFIAISNGSRPTKKQADDDPAPIVNTLCTSADGGLTWQELDEAFSPVKLDERLPSPHYINDLEQSGQNLIISLDSGLYRSSDDGKTWKLVLPPIETSSKNRKLFNLTKSGNVIFALAVNTGGC